MNGAVRIVRLCVENVGIHTRRIDLGPLSPHLNIISGGNEAGKSTLIAALRAGLFEKHDAKHRGIKALQPYGTRLAPSVWVELELDSERIHVHKRFLEKELAELRDGEHGAVRLSGADVDRYLLTRLGGHAPGGRGLKLADMGLWGLLWVSQDETAYSDPVALLDEKKDPQADEVRGALAELVGQQVGQIIGGRHGERVRTKVLENLAQFFTNDKGTPTGEYRMALQAKKDADCLVASIEQKLREVEEHAQSLQRKKQRLVELDRQRLRLEKEHADARSALRQAESLLGKEKELCAGYDAARLRAESARRARDERTQAATELETLSRRIGDEQDQLRQREWQLGGQREAHTEAQNLARTARLRATERAHELAALSRRLHQRRRIEELTTLDQQLADAEEVTKELAGLAERAALTMDAATYDRIQSLHEQARSLRILVENTGTRVLVEVAGQKPRVHPVAVSFSGEIEAVGLVRIETARPGLGKICEHLRQARTRLEQALHENGVTDVQQARELRAAAQADEEELEQLRKHLHTLVPEGTEALAQALQEATTRRQRGEQELREARQAALDLREHASELLSNPFDETTMKQLREANQRAASAQAACAQAGTLLGLRALTDVSVRIGDTPAIALKQGESTPQQHLTAQTVVRVGDNLELTLEPRGEDLTRLRTQQERAEEGLKRLMLQLEVSDLAVAESQALLRASCVFARNEAERRLKASAPLGVDALTADVERLSRHEAQLGRAAKEARQLEARLWLLEERQRTHRISQSVQSRLDKLSRELSKLEAEQRVYAARLTVDGGALGELLAIGEAVLVSETTRYELPGGVICTILPGDAAAGAELAQAERLLLGELAGLGLSDIATAERRFREGIEVQSQTASLARRLGELAPGGVEALRESVQSKRAAVMCAAAEPPTLYEADPQALLRAAENALQDAEAAAGDAERTSELRRQDCDELDRELQRRRAHRESDAHQAQKLAKRLETWRLAETDEALDQRLARAERELAESQARWQEIRDELEAMAQPELQEEERRAAKTVSDWQSEREKVHTEAIRLQTLIERAAAEGRFEQLTDAKVAQSAAEVELARLEREAKAARRLAEVVKEVYEREQQRFLMPVLKESQPYLRKLRPGTELRLSSTFKLDKVSRNGLDEEFGQLSGGTREQLAVIVRLALARVLAKASRPLPLILDDPMGWTDDERFMSMVKILRDAARELQVIILTCHPERFLRMQPDCRFDLDSLMREHESAISHAGESSLSV